MVKKIAFYIAFILIIVIIETFNWIGLLCDELIFPSYRKKEIKLPLFIIGMPRSATTFLFNALYADRDRFTSMKLWEIIFAPSIIQKKLIVLVAKLDKKLNSFLSNRLRKWEQKLFPPYEKIHQLSIFNNEEDDYILIHVLSSAILIFIFPGIKRYHSLIRFDTELSHNKKKRINAFYKRCIQKHMYVFGSNKSYLAKSPSHTSKLQSLRDTFSDCKFLYILRDPEQTISSAISMYKIYRETFYTHANLQEVTDGALNMADYWYDYPIRKIESWNNESSVIVKFEKLIADPDKLIRKLYEKFGYDISDSFYKKLSLLKGKSTTYRSSHQHSLQMYGLNVQDIQKRYNHIYKRYYSSENGNKCL